MLVTAAVLVAPCYCTLEADVGPHFAKLASSETCPAFIRTYVVEVLAKLCLSHSLPARRQVSRRPCHTHRQNRYIGVAVIPFSVQSSGSFE